MTIILASLAVFAVVTILAGLGRVLAVRPEPIAVVYDQNVDSRLYSSRRNLR